MSLYSFANWPRVVISRVWRIRTIAKLHKDQTVRVVYTVCIRLTLVLSFIGGYLIDQYFGLSDGGVIFAMVNLISQGLFSKLCFRNGALSQSNRSDSSQSESDLISVTLKTHPSSDVNRSFHWQ